MKRWYFRLLLLTLWSLTGAGACMDYGPMDEEDFDTGQTSFAEGLFIVNEGNFMYGTGSLSYYDIRSKQVENNVFLRTNGVKLGDVAQSMTIHKGLGYIVVNNSSVIFVIDIRTFELVKILKGFISPRYVHFVNDEKAYVTDLYTFAITVFNPQTLEITNRIKTDIKGKTAPSTEQMVQYKNYVFTNCWSYDNKILVVDTQTERLVDSLTVGWQPNSLLLDGNGKLWTATDGRDGEAPALWRIDPATLEIERRFELPADTPPSKLTLDARNNRIYFIARDVWRIEADAESLPATPFLPYAGTLYYGLGVDPDTAELYVADAIDYVQHAAVYRFSPDGQAVDTLRVGIIPGSFCFKRQ